MQGAHLPTSGNLLALLHCSYDRMVASIVYILAPPLLTDKAA